VNSADLKVAGMDEAGRGAWAGPVVAAIVILPKRARLAGLNDSKKLTAHRREQLFRKICAIAQVGVGMAESHEVDQVGLKKATHLAFLRAIQNVGTSVDWIWVDGNDRFTLPYPSQDVIRGDSKIRCIMAASIIAKVTRDAIMKGYAKLFQQYCFDLNKGYGTDRHHRAIQDQGLCSIHRKTYRPLRIYV